jgi:hypothetical protein
MTFSLQYELDYQRVISAVINDSRSVIPSLVGQDGNTVYAYAQAQIQQVTSGVLVYRIRTDQGNLSGFCAIQTAKTPVIPILLQLRPAAVPYFDEISQVITTFIIERQYLTDVLY